jgi:hypothetical protein
MLTGKRAERVDVRETTELEGGQESLATTPAEASRGSPALSTSDIQTAKTSALTDMDIRDTALDALTAALPSSPVNQPSSTTDASGPPDVTNPSPCDSATQSSNLPSFVTATVDSAAQLSDAPAPLNGSSNQPAEPPAVAQDPEIHPSLLAPFPGMPPHPLFEAVQLGVDRRLIVNRKRQLKMYRVWMQGKFVKL